MRGNFGAGDHLLKVGTYHQKKLNTNNPFTFDFGAAAVLGGGVQISSLTYGPFVAKVEAFASNGVRLASFTEGGNFQDTGNNSAIFIGINSDSANISKIAVSIISAEQNYISNFAINRLDFKTAVVAAPTASALGVSLTSADAAAQARVSAAYGQLPLSFEINQGQTESEANFLARGSGYTLFLTPGEAVLSLAAGAANDVVHMRIVGANPNAQSIGMEMQAGRTNYLLGNDPSQWHTDVANYGRVEYHDVYSGIDLVYYGNQRRLEYDFVVAPGADSNAIRLAFDGVRNIELDAGGNLILHTAGGDLVKDAPVVYQEIDGVRHTIAGSYLLEGGQVRFEVGLYDHARPLVIDPILSYSTYLGGNSGDDGNGIAVDSAGNAYITGYTFSTNFPTKNPLQPKNASSSQLADVFVTKLNAAGTALVYSTYVGGNGTDVGTAIAVDAAGEAYITGYTVSINFPTPNGFQTANGAGGNNVDAFVAKLSANGSALLYSTYLGGSGANSGDRGYAIALDGSGSAYVTGETTSANFPTKNALQPVKTSLNDGFHPDAFVAKIDPSQVGGPSLVYSTFLDGSNYSLGLGIAVDSLSNAYVTGWTDSSDFPTTPGAFQTADGGNNDGFVSKINPAGSALVYSTFLGGSLSDRAYGIASDGSGNAYVTGNTNSTNFPTLNALLPALRGSSDDFVTKLNAAGSALIYSTYLGGSGSEQSTANPHDGGIAVDAFGNAYVTGHTGSTDFPTTAGVFQPTFGGGQYDAFVAQVNPAGSAFVYSTYLGGSDYELPAGIAVDGSGNAYVAGTTRSSNFPTKNALQPKQAGRGEDAFVTKISSAALKAVSDAPATVAGTSLIPLPLSQAQPLLAEALARWTAAGMDVSALHGIDIRIADLGGTTLGLASGNTIWLDDNAAGWGWFVDATPWDDSEFTTPGNQGEQKRMDLLTVLEHELGHLLGFDHQETGVMEDTLAAGTRKTPAASPTFLDTTLLDLVFDGELTLAGRRLR